METEKVERPICLTDLLWSWRRPIVSSFFSASGVCNVFLIANVIHSGHKAAELGVRFRQFRRRLSEKVN